MPKGKDIAAAALLGGLEGLQRGRTRRREEGIEDRGEARQDELLELAKQEHRLKMLKLGLDLEELRFVKQKRALMGGAEGAADRELADRQTEIENSIKENERILRESNARIERDNASASESRARAGATTRGADGKGFPDYADMAASLDKANKSIEEEIFNIEAGQSSPETQVRIAKLRQLASTNTEDSLFFRELDRSPISEAEKFQQFQQRFAKTEEPAEEPEVEPEVVPEEVPSTPASRQILSTKRRREAREKTSAAIREADTGPKLSLIDDPLAGIRNLGLKLRLSALSAPPQRDPSFLTEGLPAKPRRDLISTNQPNMAELLKVLGIQDPNAPVEGQIR
jgi:hypothetical protein